MGHGALDHTDLTQITADFSLSLSSCCAPKYFDLHLGEMTSPLRLSNQSSKYFEAQQELKLREKSAVICVKSVYERSESVDHFANKKRYEPTAAMMSAAAI